MFLRVSAFSCVNCISDIAFSVSGDYVFVKIMGMEQAVGCGVMEAALRTAYEIHTGKTLEKVEFENVRGWEGIRKASVNLNGFELKVASSRVDKE